VAKRGGAAWGRKNRRQCAALPIVTAMPGTEPRVLLVTTRGAGRWVIPKGWAEPELPPHALAAREAFEEAGILGATMEGAIGLYRYRKRMPNGRRATCTVEVFALHVAGFAHAWPEQGQRQARWFTPAEAAEQVEQPQLAQLLRGLALATAAATA
jgi:8-oxo-dGTP pyrophosphatase MutT (NUDIX family)